MIEIRMSVRDLAETSFGFSPLLETALSLWTWTRPQRHALHLVWLKTTRPAFECLDTDLLTALVGPERALPEFLTPRAIDSSSEFGTCLDAVRSTPPAQVRVDLIRAYRGQQLPLSLRQADDDPAAVRDRIADEIQRYWITCLAPWWARIQSVLEADVVYRSRRLAVGGATKLFADLDPLVSWHDGVLAIDRLSGAQGLIDVAGRGLPLVPSLFVRGGIALLDRAHPPMLVYPARGRATTWEPTLPPTDHSLAMLLGRSRAHLLKLLEYPSTTTELALRTGLTTGAVSQHLQVLYAARLLSRARSGRTVIYYRTVLGERLHNGESASS